MKKILIISALIIIVTANSLCAKEKLNIVSTEFCPYICDLKNEDGEKGFVIDIFKAVFEKEGYDVQFKNQPWARTLKSFNDNTGEFDGLVAATKIHPINKEIAVFPDAEICVYRHKFYALSDSPLVGTWKYNGLESFKNIKLSGIKGWSYSSAEVTKYMNETPEPLVSLMYGDDPLRRNIMMLLKGRTDIYVENESMVEYFLFNEKKAGNKDAEKIIAVDNVPIDEGVSESYAVFYKKRNGQKYADIFTNGIKELRASGKLESIMAKYGLKDWR